MSKTLLHLMLKNNVVWPVGVLYAAQDADDNKVYFFREAPFRAQGNPVWQCRAGRGHWFGEKLNELAEDNETSAISKSEYQAAGGWVAVDSGERIQVPHGTIIDTEWDNGYKTNIRVGEPCMVSSGCGSPRIIRYRILVDEAPVNEPDPAETTQASKEAESTCTIILKTGPLYIGARIMYQSPQTIVWEHKGVETACKAEYAIINPDRNQIASQVLYQLGKVSVSPALMLELMKEMGWE